MNKLSGFLIVVVLAARLMIYINDHDLIGRKKDTEITRDQPMKLPDPKPVTEEMKVNTQGLLTFILSGNNEIYYYRGGFNGMIKKTDYVKVRELIRQHAAKTTEEDLMFLIKSTPEASFKNSIDILDEMTINKIPPGHYAEVEITKEEADKITIQKMTKNG